MPTDVFNNLIIKTKMKKIIYLAVILIIAACGKPKDKKAELADLKKQRNELNSKIATLEKEVGPTTVVEVADVSVQEVVPATFRNYLEVQGKVDAEDNVQVGPEAPGVITAIYVSAGQGDGGDAHRSPARGASVPCARHTPGGAGVDGADAALGAVFYFPGGGE